ncbi:MAG: GGDEF domain-containing protein [Alphaproteobacteria bacterium]|nr:GGDEF domain-containing protein [Alphaproteobacteria bacterium]
MQSDRLAHDFLRKVEHNLEYHFQPIVNMAHGGIYGFEALLRGYQTLGFETVQDLIGYAAGIGVLDSVETYLQSEALRAFAPLRARFGGRLFYNVDPRSLSAGSLAPSRLSGLLEVAGLDPSGMFLELSEVHDFSNPEASRALEDYRHQGFGFAVDDFGTGYSGLKLLYESKPGVVKIDRFFINDISTSEKRRLFVATVVKLAHVLGSTVVAEGVETEREFLTCKEIGCDLVQGYFVAEPSDQTTAFENVTAKVQTVARRDRRRHRDDAPIIQEQIRALPALRIDAEMHAVLEAFRGNRDHAYFPVVDHEDAPVGLVCAKDLETYLSRPDDDEQMTGPNGGSTLREFVTPCPTAQLCEPIEKVLEIFAVNDAPTGLLVVDQQRYVGFLSANALLKVMNEKNVARACDENALTRLPGSLSMNHFLSGALDCPGSAWAMVYFDFNDFKPFNDQFGFRQGDRAILLFAEMMTKRLGRHAAFLGHVGGDDFFAGFQDIDFAVVEDLVRNLLSDFNSDVADFCPTEARERGYIMARDRSGVRRRFDLLSCSAGVVELPANSSCLSLDGLADTIAQAKDSAKSAEDGMAVVHAE